MKAALRPFLVGTAVAMLSFCAQARAQGSAGKPAVLLLGQGPEIADWALPRKLTHEHGLVVGALGFDQLTWDKLRQFNAVVVFDLSRLNENTRDVNAVEISADGFRGVSDLLYRFVQEGGGLYVYGVSYTHLGQGWANDTLNEFLRPLGAQVLFEVLRDEPQERRQPAGQQVLYARADTIATHPATAGAKNYWSAVGPFSYGPWTRPLGLSRDWTPLIRTSEGFKSTPAVDASWPGPRRPSPGPRLDRLCGRLRQDGSSGLGPVGRRLPGVLHRHVRGRPGSDHARRTEQPLPAAIRKWTRGWCT